MLNHVDLPRHQHHFLVASVVEVILDLRVYVLLFDGFLRLRLFIVVHDVSENRLQGLKPHLKQATEFCESVYVSRVVVSFFVNNVRYETLSKAVAVSIERIVFFSYPEVPKFANDIVYLIFVVKGNSNWKLFFKG